MQKMFDNKHAERAPPLQSHQECWYLPVFGVSHCPVTLVGVWARLRQMSPITTHPRSRRCANGVLWGPLWCFLTLWSLRMSLPNNKRMDASGSNGGIWSPIVFRWERHRATSGEGISDLSSGIRSHSKRVGRGILIFPSRDSIMYPYAFLPEVSITPEHVFSV